MCFKIRGLSKYHRSYFKAVDIDNPDYGARQTYVISLVLYFLITLMALALWIAALIGTQWRIYYLNEAYFTPGGIKISDYPRSRGLWLVCLRNPTGAKEATFLQNAKARLEFDSCLNLGKYTLLNEATRGINDYRLATQSLGIIGGILSIILLLMTVIFFIYWRRKRNICPKVFQSFVFWLALITLVNFLVKTILMILFHEMLSYEKSASTTATNPDVFVKWTGKAAQATSESFGVMYYIAWISILLVGYSLMVLLCIGSDCLAWFSCAICAWCQCCFCRWCCDCFFICCRDCGVFHDHVVECRAYNVDGHFYTGDKIHERSVYHDHGHLFYNNRETTRVIVEEPTVRKTRIVREYEDNRAFEKDFY